MMTLNDIVEASAFHGQPEHIQRVILEWYELRNKVDKLRLFLNSSASANIAPREKELLSQQFGYMGGYKLVLEDRMTLAAVNWRKFIA